MSPRGLHSLKGISSIGFAVIICVGLASCSGAGLAPERRGNKPDLVVASPSVSDSGPAAGAQFTLSATVRNDGDEASAATTLRYYRSTDATITRSDTAVGTDAVAGLAASANGSESVELTAPSTPETYYYGACVDAVAEESDTTNNCSTSVRVNVDRTALPPDHSDTPAGATAITLSESFPGRIDSPNDVDYFRLQVDAPGTLTIRTTGNADPDIAVFDAEVEVPGVAGSWIGTITQAILDKGDLLVKFSGGNEGEEYTASATLDQPSQGHPDLVVASPSVSNSGPAAGAAFTLSATVRNDGDGDAAATSAASCARPTAASRARSCTCRTATRVERTETG